MDVLPDLRFETRPYGDPDVAMMVAEVQAEYVVRYGGEDEAAVEHDEFAPPNGLFLVGLIGDEPVVTGGWRRMPDQPGTVEVKRMYTRATARRRGLARRMLAELEATAAAAGAARVVLNTGERQPEAIAMYEAAGYGRIPGFGHYACAPGAIFFGKEL